MAYNINGISYNIGDSFICAKAAIGNTQSTGTGGKSQSTVVGTKYYLKYVVEGASYPYLISAYSDLEPSFAWFKAEIFPSGTMYTFSFSAADGEESFFKSIDTIPATSYPEGTQINTSVTAKDGYKLEKTVENGNIESKTCYGNQKYTFTWNIIRNRDIKIYAYKDPCYVIYSPGSGSGTMTSSTANYEQNFITRQCTFSPPTGYHFDGYIDNDGTRWSLTSQGVYESGQSWLWTYKKDITLTAQWAANSYTVVYNGNGNTDGNTITSSHTYDKSSKLNTNGFKKTGYNFLGWNTYSTATLPKYLDGENVVNLTNVNNGTVVLYAIWSIKKYTVSYNKNGEATIGSFPSNQTKEYNVALSLSNITPNIQDEVINTRTITFNAAGYAIDGNKTTVSDTVKKTFNKWNTSADGSGTNYYPNDQYTKNENCTLYLITSQQTSYGFVNLPRLSPPSGYRFLGWRENNSGTVYTGKYTPQQDVTLYAYFEEIRKYAIIYDKNVYSGATNMPSNVEKEEGKVAILSSLVPAIPDELLEGYKVTFDSNGGLVNPTYAISEKTLHLAFKEWNTKPNGSGVSYSPGDLYGEDKDLTLYLIANGTFTYGSVQLPTPTKDGYLFMGWSEDKTASSGITGNYTPTKETVLYAIWKSNNFTITYDTIGGLPVPENQIKKSDETIRLSSIIPYKNSMLDSEKNIIVTLNANGGFSSNSSVEALAYRIFQFNYWLDSLGVQYHPNDDYTLNANLNLHANYGESLIIKSVLLPSASKSGYRFLGWSTDTTKENIVNIVYTPTNNITLYAIYEEIPTEEKFYNLYFNNSKRILKINNKYYRIVKN